jgi:glyoxylase-like metal-dependent hydrolase (beta-lactamase superfamily II)
MPPLKTKIHISSEKGLSSISTLILGSKQAILIDPPFLLGDANSVVNFIKSNTNLPLAAVFVTHHHPDHYFSANPILDAFPSAQLLAAPYVCAGIEREYDSKVEYWPKVFGKENFHEKPPQKPRPFGFSFLALEGDEDCPVVLLGPVQGDSVDHCLFWIPGGGSGDEGDEIKGDGEKAGKKGVVICGDSVYARTTHVW